MCKDDPETGELRRGGSSHRGMEKKKCTAASKEPPQLLVVAEPIQIRNKGIKRILPLQVRDEMADRGTPKERKSKVAKLHRSARQNGSRREKALRSGGKKLKMLRSICKQEIGQRGITCIRKGWQGGKRQRPGNEGQRNSTER